MFKKLALLLLLAAPVLKAQTAALPVYWSPKPERRQMFRVKIHELSTWSDSFVPGCRLSNRNNDHRHYVTAEPIHGER